VSTAFDCHWKNMEIFYLCNDFNLTTRNPWFGSFLINSYSHQGNPDRNHDLLNIGATERDILHIQVLLQCCYIQMDS